MTTEIDFDELTQVQNKLTSLADEASDVVGRTTSFALSYSSLNAGAINLQNKWKETTQKLIDKIEQLREGVSKTSEEMQKQDAQASSAITKVDYFVRALEPEVLS